jgi:hypothetical protein
LIEDSADLAKMDIGTKEDNERRRRREAVKDMLARIEVTALVHGIFWSNNQTALTFCPSSKVFWPN